MERPGKAGQQTTAVREDEINWKPVAPKPKPHGAVEPLRRGSSNAARQQQGGSRQKEYEQLEAAVRIRNYSSKTLEAYIQWTSLRISECLRLRVHCLNLESMLVTVHDGKGQKDRTVPLPAKLEGSIREQLEAVKRLHEGDMAREYAGVFLPRLLERKYRKAATSFIWQWLFPAANLTRVPGTGEQRRYHLHDAQVQAAVKSAAERAGIPKRVSPHTFRHTYASHLLLAGYDLQTIQRLLGHGDIKTTMIYLQTVPSVTVKEARSPLDL